MSTDVEIVLLPTGEIRISRGNKEQNEALLELLKDLSEEELTQVKRFLAISDQVEVLEGQEPLCG